MMIGGGRFPLSNRIANEKGLLIHLLRPLQDPRQRSSRPPASFPQGALFCSNTTNNSYSRRRWFSPVLSSISKSSAQAVSLGLAGVVVFATAASVYAKERPPAEIKPKDVVLNQFMFVPASSQVRVFLDFYDIPYKVVQVHSFTMIYHTKLWKSNSLLVVDGEQLVDTSDSCCPNSTIDKLAEKVLPKKTIS
ncbi:PREDICTED: uncharacterized protein LOC108661126 [Theobroma cacao]|uniref:Uncharacterized protein LOC108661126 n=1 Tax=Theobroma cacao TaxID=3641 RepID=A0AB32W201_THECC|nr:PREDICTED: uncharacterized protein LOC108661126 [Theobroma cacao]